MSKTISVLLWILSLIFIVDGIYLFSLGKLHLGTILPFLIGITVGFYLIFQAKVHNFLKQKPKLFAIWKIGITAGIIWFISVVVFFSYLKINLGPNSIQTPVSAIIVLGSGTEQGKPSPALQARLDAAAMLAKQQPQTLMVLSGGIDYGQVLSEAQVMANYLNTEYQISLNRMILEKESTSTELNLINSQKRLKEHEISLQHPIAIVTSDFHTIRASKIAKKVGYQNPYMLSATTPFNIRYNSWLREYFAFLSGWILNEY